MMAISGNATTTEGLPADFVRIFSWPTSELVGVAVPDESGDWSHDVLQTGEYGLTYIAAGCQPITHGPYLIQGLGDTHWGNVVALLHFDGDLTDEKGNAWTGSGSIAPDGRFQSGLATSAAHIQTPRASWNDLSSGQGDFTVEMFIKQTAPNTASALISHVYPGNGGRLPFVIAFGKVSQNTASNHLYFGHFNGSWIGANSNWEPVSGQWHHIAASREGSIYRLFADGLLIASFTNSAAVAANGSALYIGRRWDNLGTGSPLFQGVIDDLRITKGVARYTTYFIPPTVPFPNHGPA